MDSGKAMLIVYTVSLFILSIFVFLFVWMCFQYQHEVMRQQIREMARYNIQQNEPPLSVCHLGALKCHDSHVVEIRPTPPPPIATRPPFSGEFRQIGVLLSIEHDQGALKRHQILPLLARQVHSRSDRWHYFTLTNGYREIRLSVQNGNKDCLNEYGCEELHNGDVVTVPQYHNSQFKVSLYEKHGPIYDPTII